MSFKRIKYDPRYEINEYGEIYNQRGKKVRGSTDKSGSLVVRLAGDIHSRTVHRLVAEAFIPNPENKDYVIHKDGNKQNNFVNNLKWVSRKEYQEELYLRYGKNHNAGLTNKPIKINETGEEFGSISSCAKYLGVTSSAIRQQLNGSIKKCKGYTFTLL